MADICVVHLVWKPLGLAPLRDFVESYRRNPGGVSHRLVVAFNGFAAESELEEYHEALAGVDYEWFRIFPSTQDIPVYFEAARRSESDYLCYLNSYSVLLDDEWLAKLYQHAQRPEVGLVGATGSWTSLYSWMRWELGKRSAYEGIMADLNVPRADAIDYAGMFGLSQELRARIGGMPLPKRLALLSYYHGIVAPYYVLTKSTQSYSERRKRRKEKLDVFTFRDYKPFPAPHLRTNGFMLQRGVMLGLRHWEMLLKSDASRFESGRQSMTNQVLKSGLKVLVTDINGRAYETEEWASSEVFWQGEQRNLMIADNQTRHYDQCEPAAKLFLSRLAWGLQSAVAFTGN